VYGKGAIINEKLLSNAITFAKRFTEISNETIKIIRYARKSLLFNSNSVWVKKSGNFDFAMGSLDGAEVCELVGLFLLDKLANILGKKNVGLYQDDGLAIIKGSSGLKIESTRKKIIKLFQKCNLRITSDCNLKRTDFLDVCLDLESGKYSSYRKPNDKPLYINAKSNHSSTIKKQLPHMISK